MKKTIFTISSIALVCCAIMMSCSKDNTNGEYHVGYYAQPGSAPGSTLTTVNPNPNGTPYAPVTPTTSTTNTTVTTNTTTTNFTVDGTSAASPTTSGLPSGGNFIVLAIANTSDPQIQITFPGTSAPATGSYTITNGTPTGNQCGFLLTTTVGVYTAASGIVSVTAAASPGNTATFSGIICSNSGVNHIASGTIKY
jgi:hypothetical protein